MKKTIRAAALLTCAAVCLSACTKYSTYADGVNQNTKAVARAREEIARVVLSKLLDNFDKASMDQAADRAKAPLATFQYTDSSGPHTNTIYTPPSDPALMAYMAGAGRAAVLREAVPLVHALIDGMSQDLKGPVTPEDVLLRIAQDGATMVTMGAMYGLGKAAIKSAQGNMTSNISNGGSVSTDGAEGKSEYNPTTDNSVKSEAPKTEAPKTEAPKTEAP